MKHPKFMTTEERRGYDAGYKTGYTEGMKKAAMLIHLVACNTEQFTESIIQSSPEAIELRRTMTGKE